MRTGRPNTAGCGCQFLPRYAPLVTPVCGNVLLSIFFFSFFLILFLAFSEEALSAHENIYWELESSTQRSCVVKMMQKLLKRTGYKESSGTLGCRRDGIKYGRRRTRLVLGSDPHVHAQQHLMNQCCPHCVFSRGFPSASHMCWFMDAKRGLHPASHIYSR